MLTRGVVDTLRGAWARFVRSPGLQLVVCGVVLALAFPARSSGAIGLTIIGAALGVGVAMLWPTAPAWLKKPEAWVTSILVITIVTVAGITEFWDVMTTSPDWQMGDWGPQHAVLSHVMPSLPGVHAPVWNHTLSTGDAPLELYPSLAYFITGHVALALGLERDVPLALMVVAVVVHVGTAVATTAIAMRIAPKPVALVVGLLALVDSGAVAHGGTVGLFRWALLHSAMSLAFALVAALGVLAALRRPRIGASIAIWLGTALAVASHPAGLIAASASIVALAAVALLAHDVPPRRALVAMGHIVLGMALAAAVWMPLAERILLYGQHFSNALRTPLKLLEDLLQWPTPVTAYALFVYAGYIGIVVGLWSRRALVVFVSTVALVLLVGMCDQAYLAFDLAPGKGIARLGTERLAQLARPFLAATGAYAIGLLGSTVVRGWKPATTRQKLIAAAVIGVMSCAVVRVLPLFWRSATERATAEAAELAPDPAGRAALTGWAMARAGELRPDAWARAVFEEDTHEEMHLTALTGLPTFHMGPLPDLLLRERIEDLSDASLRRFNVRWAIGLGKSPSIGDEASEQVFGRYHVREIKAWDGQFARIEKGAGTVKTVRLDDDAVEIEVTGTEPVLVALGTGFYPRWRAHHASGADEPVYALPTIEGGALHVVSAWVAPGRTTFTCDGPLPSDGKGRLISLLAALLAAGAIIAWKIRRLRWRILRRVARLRARMPAAISLAAHVGVPLVCIVLLARGCFEQHAVAPDLELGSGVRATATVEARLGDDPWQTCSYARAEGVFYCEGLLVARDATTRLLNDAPPSWQFITPAIIATADVPGTEIRVRLHARLEGTYWTAVNDGSAALRVDGDEERTISNSMLTYGAAGDRTVEIVATIPALEWELTFVREDTLVPARDYLVAPPEVAPAAVTAIGRGR